MLQSVPLTNGSQDFVDRIVRSTRPEDLASDLRVFVLQRYQRQAGFDMSDITATSSAGWKNH